MKKIVFLACALLIGGFAAQAQEDSETVGATTTKTKVVLKKETKRVSINTDATNTTANKTRNNEMTKVLAERKKRAAKIKAEKAAEMTNKTGVTTSKARVMTKEMLEAEKEEKRRKATKKDN